MLAYMAIPSTSSKPPTPAPRIIAADQLNDGLVIKFDNGQCGFYSDAYLFSMLGGSQVQNETLVKW